jgi:hypothetical protein
MYTWLLVRKPERKRPLARPRIRWEDSILIYNRRGGGHGLDLSDSGCTQMPGSCEGGNENSGFHKMRGIS